MLPEIGHYALILAFCLAILQASIPLIGAQLGISSWMHLAKPLVYTQLLLLLVSFVCLEYAFITNDFSVAYVAHNSNSLLPIQYRMSALWGAHEGSLLLWVLILSGWTAAVAFFSRQLPTVMVARVLAVMGLISVGFLLFMLETSNPFERYLPSFPAEGKDLNPLLQDFGLIVHPPMLYMGYVGFSVAFAFAVAALLGGRLDATWARWSRPWTTIAWLFLTGGIALGSWWAYYELGWGGWWFWDPVENASFMPWLVGTALIHSLAVTEKREAFKGWTVLLAIFAFSLSLLGTFLVRSGVLTSVHAFATDPERGAFILKFLAVVIGGSLILYAWRAPRIKSVGRFSLVSRESFLLLNNVILFSACCMVLLGTLYPLIIDALGMGKISVGPPYFNALFVPMMCLLALVLGFGVLSKWKKMEGNSLLSLTIPMMLIALCLSGVVAYVYTKELAFYVMLGVSLAFWLVIATLFDFTAKASTRKGKFKSIGKLSASTWGMVAAHLGFAITIIGVAITSVYEVERDVSMQPGDRETVAGYEFQFVGVREAKGPNYTGAMGEFLVFKDGEKITALYPEKRFYTVQQTTMTEAAIDAGLFRDLYVSLGEPLEGKAWAIRVYHKPFVRWIWLGAIFMMLGGLLAVADKRYRKIRQAKTTNTSSSPASMGGNGLGPAAPLQETRS